MDSITSELGLSTKNVYTTASPSLFTVIVNTTWLKKWLKDVDIDNFTNNDDFSMQPGESINYPWKKIFIKVLSSVHVFYTQ